MNGHNVFNTSTFCSILENGLAETNKLSNATGRNQRGITGRGHRQGEQFLRFEYVECHFEMRLLISMITSHQVAYVVFYGEHLK